MNEIVIRRATPADGEQIGEIIEFPRVVRETLQLPYQSVYKELYERPTHPGKRH